MSIPDPIVLLDARAKYVHPAFQMTRASVKNILDGGGRMREVPAGALGWDRRGLLLEPARTNLLSNSEIFGSGSGWSRFQISVSAGAAKAPDGTMTMSKLVEDTNTGTHVLHQTLNSPAVSGDIVCLSIFARPGERTMMRLSLSDGGNSVRVVFDLATGQRLGASEAGGTLADADIEPLGDGLFRVWIAANLPGLTSVKVEYELVHGGSVAYPGDGVSGLYVSGAQLEEGRFATSLIRTSGSTAARPGDAATFPSLTSTPWWRQEHGSMVLEFENGGQHAGGTDRLITLTGFLRVNYAPDGRLRLEGGGVDPWLTFLSTEDAAKRMGRRIAFAWGDGDVVAVASGAAPVTGTLVPGQSASGLTLGGSAMSALRRVVYYPARISNADLQSLTAIQE